MLIDISCLGTYPEELESMVVSYLSELPEVVKTKIKVENVVYEIDVRCTIEDYVGPYKAKDLYCSFLDVMNDKEIILYHSTKVLNRNCFLEKGLLPIE